MTVAFVATGPGDPLLLTVQVEHLLDRADAVAHEPGVDLRILALVGSGAKVVDNKDFEGVAAKDYQIKPLPAGTFCLEISEQQIIGDPSYLAPAVQALRDAGMLIAIDDVGFGSSCLESLVLLAPDILKIDKRCVIGIDEDPPRIEHLRRYVRIAHTLGCAVIAEGIETAGELAVVRSLGIEYGQGYFWGKPA